MHRFLGDQKRRISPELANHLKGGVGERELPLFVSAEGVTDRKFFLRKLERISDQSLLLPKQKTTTPFLLERARRRPGASRGQKGSPAGIRITDPATPPPTHPPNPTPNPF